MYKTYTGLFIILVTTIYYRYDIPLVVKSAVKDFGFCVNIVPDTISHLVQAGIHGLDA